MEQAILNCTPEPAPLLTAAIPTTIRRRVSNSRRFDNHRICAESTHIRAFG
jgi:hypothetical protein